MRLAAEMCSLWNPSTGTLTGSVTNAKQPYLEKTSGTVMYIWSRCIASIHRLSLQKNGRMC